MSRGLGTSREPRDEPWQPGKAQAAQLSLPSCKHWLLARAQRREPDLNISKVREPPNEYNETATNTLQHEPLENWDIGTYISKAKSVSDLYKLFPAQAEMYDFWKDSIDHDYQPA